MLADLLLCGAGAEDVVDAALDLRGLPVHLGRYLLVDVPAEDVADRRLPCLVAEQPGDDPAVDDPAHSGHLAQDG